MKKGASPPWSDEESARLRDLFEQTTPRLSMGKIAKLMPGRNIGMVVGRCYRMKLERPLPPGYWPDKDTVRSPGSVRTPEQIRRRAVSQREVDGQELPPMQPLVEILPLPPPGFTAPERPPQPAPGFIRARRGCVFPLWGHQEAPSHLYCEAPVRALADGGGAYCAEHAAQCFTREGMRPLRGIPFVYTRAAQTDGDPQPLA